MANIRRIIRAAPLDSFVAQRRVRDCAIATAATITGRTYEEIAQVFGIPLNHEGVPDADALGPGIYTQDMVYPLLGLGWIAAPMIAREHRGNQDDKRQSKQPSSDMIKASIAGRRAILGYQDDDENVGDHSVAWSGKEAIDCSDGAIIDLDSLTLSEALILGPAPLLFLKSAQ